MNKYFNNNKKKTTDTTTTTTKGDQSVFVEVQGEGGFGVCWGQFQVAVCSCD